MEVAAADALARLRPRSAPEVVDAAVQLVRQAFRPLAVLGAVNVIPGLVLGPVMQQFLPSTGTMPTPGAAAGLFGALALWMCLYSIGTAAMVRAASDAVLGRDPDAGAALRFALSRAGALIVAHLAAYFRAFFVFVAALLVVGIVIGLLLVASGARAAAGSGPIGALTIVGALGAFVASVGVLTRYAVMTPAIVLERLGARAGLARSAELTAGSRWRVFLLLVALYGTSVGASLAMAQLLQLIVRNQHLATALNSVLWIPATAFVACIFTLLYYDLRIRREGYDIELLASQLERPAAAPALPPPAIDR
ncbi:MAG TPA: hypothetical protein VKA84_00705 [Gemmatimonadaceae bacterium]|nr:hypothetical protein [Gemmatimonadaceae bacterium]